MLVRCCLLDWSSYDDGSKNRRAFPDARDQDEGRIRRIVGGEMVRASQPVSMERNNHFSLCVSKFTRMEVEERLRYASAALAPVNLET